jgi:fatty acid desaturase
MKYTKINNKYYDLTNFKHPGGETALWHSYGRDATILFRSHHPFVSENKLETILKKYEISELPKGVKLYPNEENVPTFNYDTNFSNELKSEVKKYFNKQSNLNNIRLLEATKATYSRWTIITLLTLIKIFCNILWIKGYWSSILLFPLFDWLSDVNVFHDGSHFALSLNQNINLYFAYIFGISLTNVQYWAQQHNVAHHGYSNIYKKDPDLHVSLTKYHEKIQAKLSPWKQILITFTLFWTKGVTIVPISLIYKSVTRHFMIPIKFWNIYTFLFERFIYLFFYILLPFFLFDFYKALCFSLIPRIIYSLMFMFNSQITHIHTPCMIQDNDWYAHQVITSTNHGMDKWFNFIFSGGLNYQIEHHLFPNINHCHLPYIQPIVKRICKKHNIEYKEFNGYYDAFLSYYKHIVMLNKTDNNFKK